MVNANLVPITISDFYLADFWRKIFPNIRVHENLILSKGGDIAFGFRKNSPELKKALDAFTDKNKMGSSFGNQKIQTYLKSVKWVKNATDPTEIKKFHALANIFQKYSSQYQIDWLLMTAQGYQESHLDQNKKSKVGAIGVSGDTSCTDHATAWRIRAVLGLNKVPGGFVSGWSGTPGFAVLGDEMIIDTSGNSVANTYYQVSCAHNKINNPITGATTGVIITTTP